MLTKRSHKNLVVIASAGSLKTTGLVKAALAQPLNKRLLVTTYTVENLETIRRMFVREYGCVPANVTILSWYSVLLRDGARPYQGAVVSAPRIRSIHFGDMPMRATRATRSTEPERYFLSLSGDIYRDRLSDFVHEANQKSGGLVINRLSRCYDSVFIDEFQDMNGWDLEVVDKLFKSPMEVTCVGDPRQSTYFTNRASKNKQFKGMGVLKWLAGKENRGELQLASSDECYRCNQQICDFADQIFQTMPRTRSLNTQVTGHDGIFLLRADEVPEYAARYRPMMLRHSKSTDTFGLAAMNFGAAKGATFDRVMIFPTKAIREFVASRDPEKLTDPCRFYVAVTRARYSVAIVTA